MKEASILVSLSHKNVLQFYGIYTSPQKLRFIVTEFLNKGSLRDLLLTESTQITSDDQISM
jgi:serine/threonine protein kinase